MSGLQPSELGYILLEVKLNGLLCFTDRLIYVLLVLTSPLYLLDGSGEGERCGICW